MVISLTAPAAGETDSRQVISDLEEFLLSLQERLNFELLASMPGPFDHTAPLNELCASAAWVALPVAPHASRTRRIALNILSNGRPDRIVLLIDSQGIIFVEGDPPKNTLMLESYTRYIKEINAAAKFSTGFPAEYAQFETTAPEWACGLYHCPFLGSIRQGRGLAPSGFSPVSVSPGFSASIKINPSSTRYELVLGEPLVAALFLDDNLTADNHWSGFEKTSAFDRSDRMKITIAFDDQAGHAVVVRDDAGVSLEQLGDPGKRLGNSRSGFVASFTGIPPDWNRLPSDTVVRCIPTIIKTPAGENTVHLSLSLDRKQRLQMFAAAHRDILSSLFALGLLAGGLLFIALILRPPVPTIISDPIDGAIHPIPADQSATYQAPAPALPQAILPEQVQPSQPVGRPR